MAETKTDKYANIYLTEVTMSANNTLTFAQINIGVSLFDRMGLLIHRVEYIPSSGSWAQMASVGDEMWFGLVTSNQVAFLSANDNSVVDYARIKIAGTVDGFMGFEEPLIHSYSDLPEAGLLVAPEPLYAGMNSASFAAVGAVTVRLYYTLRKMTDADYFELLETRRSYS